MKVKELIERLEKIDPEMTVIGYFGEDIVDTKIERWQKTDEDTEEDYVVDQFRLFTQEEFDLEHEDDEEEEE